MHLITLGSEILKYGKKRSVFFQNYLKILHLLKKGGCGPLFVLLTYQSTAFPEEETVVFL